MLLLSMTRKITLLLFILWSVLNLSSQTEFVYDSTLIGGQEINPTLIKDLCDSCWENRFVSPERARKFGETALYLSKKMGYESGLAQAYNDLGILFIDEANYDQAIAYFEVAMTLRQHLHDTLGMAALYNKLGIVYQKQGNLGEALESQLQALEIYELRNIRAYQAICMNNIAIIHQNLGNYDQSLAYHRRALHLRIDLADNKGEGESYLNMANVYLKLSDTVSAIENYQKALSIFQHFRMDEALGTALNNLGSLYVAQKHYNEALPLLRQALDLRMKSDDKKALSSTYAKLGEAYLGMNKTKESKHMLLKSMQLADEVGVVEEEMETYGLLSGLYANIQLYDSAWYFGKIYLRLRDSVYQHRLDQQIVEVQARYDNERQKADNQLLLSENQLFESQLKQRRTEILLLIFIIISLIGAAIFYYYRYRQRQRDLHTRALFKQNELRMQAVIEAQEGERRRIARDLHDSVGQKLSGIRLQWESMAVEEGKVAMEPQFRNIKSLLDETVEEVRGISHQMMPKELEQFGLVPAIEQMIHRSFHADTVACQFEHHGLTSRLSKQVELALFRILQELISNILKHANARFVTIQLIKSQRNLVLVVEDDGIGFDTVTDKPTGIGMMNIESRVNTISGHLHVESEPGKGTVITIRIPLK